VWSLDERKRLVARQVAEVAAAGRQEAFTLRLASGRDLEVTADQAFMTLAGWMALRDLNVGARIVVPRRVPEPSQPQRMADDEIVLLAHMIGDGSCVKNQPIRYASIDEENLRAVTRAAKHFGIGHEREPDRNLVDAPRVSIRDPRLSYEGRSRLVRVWSACEVLCRRAWLLDVVSKPLESTGGCCLTDGNPRVTAAHR
jgi:intein/homing endonuclease